jgi:dTDP-4-amino-4,6-dideoxygalactose transaminase
MIKLNSPIKPDLKRLYKYLETINSNGWFTNFGPIHNEFKARLEEYLEVENLLLVNNGTTALQVAGRVLNSKNIITTPFSFTATSSAFSSQGDNLYFADVDRASFNLDANKVAEVLKKHDVDTILATHVYGNPCDVNAFDVLSINNNKKVIYDAAHCFGVKVNNQSVLSYGDASILSFHATKVFHSIEGGAIVFKSNDNYELAKEYINFGINPQAGTVRNVGVNGKLNEYQAAVGLVNLDVIDDYIDHRAELFELYRSQLKDIVELPLWYQGSSVNGAYMPIKVLDFSTLNKLKSHLLESGIECRQYFTPSLDTIYPSKGDVYVPISHELASSVLCLPLHANLSRQDVLHVTNAVKIFYE